MEADSEATVTSAAAERRALRVVIALLALTACAGVWLQRHPPPAGGALALALPDRVGAWQGAPLYYCQNERCLRRFTVDELGRVTDRCPVCGARLDTVSLAERQSLPADTLILRKRYVNADREELSVSVAVSGREQKSLVADEAFHLPIERAQRLLD